MTNFKLLLIGILFLQRNSAIHDMRHGIFNFPFFLLQMKNEDRTYPNLIEPWLNQKKLHYNPINEPQFG